MAEDSFILFVLGQLERVEGLGCRAMFGGYGLYQGTTFFGIVFDGRLYLKTNVVTEERYVRRGMTPFRPSERQTLKTYFEVPADVLDDAAELSAWAAEGARCAAPVAKPQARA